MQSFVKPFSLRARSGIFRAAAAYHSNVEGNISNVKIKHSLTVESRSRTLITGVEKVISSSPAAIDMTTSEGPLTVKGEGLRIHSFSAADGDLTFEGRVDSLTYARAKKPLLGRIFK